MFNIFKKIRGIIEEVDELKLELKYLKEDYNLTVHELVMTRNRVRDLEKDPYKSYQIERLNKN